MRPNRLLAGAGRPGLYHVTSRVVDKRMIFGDGERAKFMHLAKSYAEFCGVDLVSWCVMGNHFHLLIRIPVIEAEKVADEEVLRRCGLIYKVGNMEVIRGSYALCSTERARKDFLEVYRERMGRLPEFVGAVKKAFTMWYNRKNGREGTLWEGRYHSTLLEHVEDERRMEESGLGGLARLIAAYIDLNPLRAGVVAEPEGNDWSGYGCSVRGDAVALRGLRMLWGNRVGSRKGLLAAHRAAVYEEGSEEKVPEHGAKSQRAGISREKVLRARQEWSKARAIGGAAFVAGVAGGGVITLDNSCDSEHAR